MSRTISINKNNRLVCIEDGKETVLTDEQCASFFDRPNTPGYYFTMWLFRSQPKNAEKWIELRLQQLDFVRKYIDYEKNKEEE